jgi:hypothetical protein
LTLANARSIAEEAAASPIICSRCDVSFLNMKAKGMKMFRVILVGVMLGLGACASSGPRVQSAHGGFVEPLGADASGLVVLVFSSPDCPIANALAPALERLHTQTKRAGGTMYLVHARTDVTPARAIAHARDYELTMDVLLDHAHTLVDAHHATVTPEGLVFVRDGNRWREVYQGSINNLYASLGNRRDVATEHWLGDAIAAAAQGGSVTPAYRVPLGCFIEQLP